MFLSYRNYYSDFLTKFEWWWSVSVIAIGQDDVTEKRAD